MVLIYATVLGIWEKVSKHVPQLPVLWPKILLTEDGFFFVCCHWLQILSQGLYRKQGSDGKEDGK